MDWISKTWQLFIVTCVEGRGEQSLHRLIVIYVEAYGFYILGGSNKKLKNTFFYSLSCVSYVLWIMFM